MAQFLISSTIGIGLLVLGALLTATFGIVNYNYQKAKIIAECLNALDPNIKLEHGKIISFKVNNRCLKFSKHQIIYMHELKTFHVITYNNLNDSR